MTPNTRARIILRARRQKRPTSRKAIMTLSIAIHSQHVSLESETTNKPKGDYDTSFNVSFLNFTYKSGQKRPTSRKAIMTQT